MSHNFFDCHTHTEFSSCAEDVTLEAYTEIAATTASAFAVTDHSAQIFYSPDNRWGFWSDEALPLFEEHREGGEERIAEYIAAVRDAQCGGMQVGIELDVLPDGRKVFPDGLLETLDVVGGAVHSMPALRHSRPVEEIHAEFRRQVEALASHGIDVLVHPYRLILAADVPVPEDLQRWTTMMAREAGFALEINSHYQFPEHDVRMVRFALEVGATIAIGTDSHRMEEFGDFSYHEQIMRKAGLTPETWQPHIFRARTRQHEAAAE